MSAPAPHGPNSPATEHRIDTAVRRRLEARGQRSGPWTEFCVFVLKQAWACLFGALMLACIVAAALWYPAGARLARNDALTLAALAIQAGMLVLRLETAREALVIVVFHVAGTAMEVFKTHAGSWEYAAGGVLHIGAVPLFTGFMYAAVGSYLMRVMRLFDLRFTRFPPLWLAGALAAAAYSNFFAHQWIWDARWCLVAAVVLAYGRCTMTFRVRRTTGRMPVVVAFALVAVFIWLAENIGTAAGAWAYPDQAGGWHPVSIAKLGSWFLLMQLSVFLVTLVSRPQAPEGAPLGLSASRR